MLVEGGGGGGGGGIRSSCVGHICAHHLSLCCTLGGVLHYNI